MSVKFIQRSIKFLVKPYTLWIVNAPVSKLVDRKLPQMILNLRKTRLKIFKNIATFFIEIYIFWAIGALISYLVGKYLPQSQ